MEPVQCFLDAVMRGDVTGVEKGIDKDKSILTAKNAEGRTALHLAALYGQPEVVQVLVRRGIPLSTTDHRGQTALHLAAQGSSAEIARLLLGSGASCSLRDKDGKTPLFYAYKNSSPELLTIFLDSTPICGGGCALTPEIVLAPTRLFSPATKPTPI